MTLVRSLVNKYEVFYETGSLEQKVAQVSVGDIGTIVGADVVSYPTPVPVESTGKYLIKFPIGVLLMGFREVDVIDE